MTCSSIYALIHKLERDGGVWFAMGGTNRLVAGMVSLFERLGGTLRLGDQVEAIEVVDGSARAVRTVGGWRGEADAVATNGDVVASYELHRGRQARAEAGTRARAQELFAVAVRASLRAGGTFPDIPHHMILFGPRYERLLGDIYDRGVVAPDPSLYLHHPTATDPSMAPPGCSTFYALAPVPHLGKRQDRLGDGGRTLCRDHHRHDRGAADPRHPRAASAPVFTTRRAISSPTCSRISAAPSASSRCCGSRPGSASTTATTRSATSIFVGAGTHPGAGIPGVVGSAEATAGLMLAGQAAE